MRRKRSEVLRYERPARKKKGAIAFFRKEPSHKYEYDAPLSGYDYNKRDKVNQVLNSKARGQKKEDGNACRTCFGLIQRLSPPLKIRQKNHGQDYEFSADAAVSQSRAFAQAPKEVVYPPGLQHRIVFENVSPEWIAPDGNGGQKRKKANSKNSAKAKSFFSSGKGRYDDGSQKKGNNLYVHSKRKSAPRCYKVLPDVQKIQAQENKEDTNCICVSVETADEDGWHTQGTEGCALVPKLAVTSGVCTDQEDSSDIGQ